MSTRLFFSFTPKGGSRTRYDRVFSRLNANLKTFAIAQTQTPTPAHTFNAVDTFTFILLLLDDVSHTIVSVEYIFRYQEES